jgi:sec-independent protein translocase protein TatC
MTFLEHLEDLRKRLVWSLGAVFIAVIPAFMFARPIYAFLSKPLTQYLPEGIKLVYTGITEPFMLYMKVAFVSSLFVSCPFIFYQIWKFVAPGLYQKEKKYVWPFVFFTSAFFMGGAAFGYYVAFPFACKFFLNMGGDFSPMITVETFFGVTLKVLLGIGLVFEMPTLIFFLAKMGIVTSRWMIKNFKFAVLAVFIIAAVITPTPDIINQSMIAAPMLVLYTISIGVAFLFGKEKKTRRAKKAAAKGEDAPAG